MSIEIRQSKQDGLFNLVMDADGTVRHGLVSSTIAAEIERLQRCEAALEIAETELEQVANALAPDVPDEVFQTSGDGYLLQIVKDARDVLAAIAEAKAGPS